MSPRCVPRIGSRGRTTWCVLQERDQRDDSGFQAFVIDTTLGRQKLRRLTWNGAQYVPIGAPGSDAAFCREPWTNFQINRYGRRDSSKLNDATYGELDDLGV